VFYFDGWYKNNLSAARSKANYLDAPALSKEVLHVAKHTLPLCIFSMTITPINWIYLSDFF
jgi:hypothetical protein